MNISGIEKKLTALTTHFDKDSFIYNFILAYGLPKASITRLKKGNLNLSKDKDEISWKKKLFFRVEQIEDLHITLTNIEESLSHKQRFVIVTDFKTWLAADTKTGEKLDIPFKDLPQYYDFFLPWAGMEKTQHQNENPADVKAAEKMAKLFDEIKKDNPQDDEAFIKDLNVFLSRLLFCFFAEDTNIFEDNQFTNALASHTKVDGGDLNQFFDEMFNILNTAKRKRGKIAAWLNAFPYVNGGLFERTITAPTFTRKSRQAIIAAGELNWKDINPDIFGSMFQAVIGVEQRGNLGQHYTSVPNIMKVIEPLFLNDLYEEFEKAANSSKKLNTLLNRITKLKIFDPACGSGNFLIIAYKELRRLEIKIFLKLSIGIPFSAISLTQFYGIEIDAFAVEIAQLSLWLAEHQMNVEFFQAFGKTNPTLPLKQAGHIICENACRIDWEEVCTKGEEEEIYILGNPPYLGFKMQDKNQKEDIAYVFAGIKGHKKLDYISCWFYKSAQYISNANSKFAFVSTNSICQGEHAGLLWPNILDLGLEIYFAHKSFKWANNAKSKAAVFCCIPGVSNISKTSKFLYSSESIIECKDINVYLSPIKSGIVYKKSTPLSAVSRMTLGNMPKDDGNFILSKEQKEDLITANPGIEKFIRELVGAYEYLNGQKKWCIWIKDEELDEALSYDVIRGRIENVRKFRLASSDKSANKMALTSHKFREQNGSNHLSLILPTVSSQRRKYIPIGYLNPNQIIVAPNNAIYDPQVFLFSIISSEMHMAWMRMFGGKLKSDYRYSSVLVYNTFPFPLISSARKEELTTFTFRILEEREKHPEKTLAQLYDPEKMPEELREVHRLNDLAVERCYRSKPFDSDEERLEYLFKLYEKMIQEEKDPDSLFQQNKKT